MGAGPADTTANAALLCSARGFVRAATRGRKYRGAAMAAMMAQRRRTAAAANALVDHRRLELISAATERTPTGGRSRRFIASRRSTRARQVCKKAASATGSCGRSAGLTRSMRPSKWRTIFGTPRNFSESGGVVLAPLPGRVEGGGTPVRRNQIVHPSEYVAEAKSVFSPRSCSGLAKCATAASRASPVSAVAKFVGNPSQCSTLIAGHSPSGVRSGRKTIFAGLKAG